MLISKTEATASGAIQVPSSKSISNRVLIIRALCEKDFKIHDLSTATDTQTLEKLLNEMPPEMNAEDGGTTMRFLCAYLAANQGEWTLLGSNRAHKRPIGLLVDALGYLGAQIQYLNEDGYPPLHIKGSNLYGGTIPIPANVSSQYISSLLMIAPTLPGGLGLVLEGEKVSTPYIDMTLKLLDIFGIETERRGSEIDVFEMPYQAKNYKVEADWSSASYFYEIMALASQGDILLSGLRQESLQGDQKIAELMEPLGVNTVFTDKGVQLNKGVAKKAYKADLSATPDLAPTLIVSCAGLGIPAEFKGLETLSLKESNRIEALTTELKKLGVELKQVDDTWLLSGQLTSGNYVIETYQDHRMALSFAPLAMLGGSIHIDDSDVVNKSYPDYWEALQSLNFSLS